MPAPDASPWRADRPWVPAGEPGELDRRGRRALWWGILALVVVFPWNALAAGRPDLLWPGVVVAADAVPVALLGRAAWLRARWRVRGAVRLRFDRFPFFLGEPFEAVLALSPGGGHGAVEVTLACLERRTAPGEAAPEEVEIYRATLVLVPAAESEIAFELPMPERGIGTALRAPEARRWELRVRGRSGARADEVFPVPVYAPPPAIG